MKTTSNQWFAKMLADFDGVQLGEADEVRHGHLPTAVLMCKVNVLTPFLVQ